MILALSREKFSFETHASLLKSRPYSFFYLFMTTTNPLLVVAPMEGLTGAPFRKVHAKLFGPADAYYLPFVSPTTTPAFTDRQLRELAPKVNAGIHAVPQLLTRNTEDFIWAAKALANLGYDEVNLNFGCPAGTVVAKGKGSGFLRTPHELERFLEVIFEADLPIDISVKTRLGWSDEDEFDAIAEVYNRFPMKHLTIHPRLRTDHYKGDVRRYIFDDYYRRMTMPLGYNGDIVTNADLDNIQNSYPDLALIMVGRALMSDPALFRKAKGGSAASREEIIEFSRALFESYARAFDSQKNAMMRMKEYWFFQHNLFDGAEKIVKSIYKAKTIEDYEKTVRIITEELPIRTESLFGWHKPL